MCGDYRETASIQGALASGRRAAEAVTHDLAGQGRRLNFDAGDQVCGKIVRKFKTFPPGHSSVAQWQSIRLLTEGL